MKFEKVREVFDKAKEKLGEKLFPDMEKKKRKRLAGKLITWFIVALICMTGVGILRYRAERELRQYQRIADAYRQMEFMLYE